MISPATAGWIRTRLHEPEGTHVRFDFGGILRINVDPSRRGEPFGHYIPPHVEVFRKGTAVAKVATHPSADQVLGAAILLHEIGHMVCSSEAGAPSADMGKPIDVEKRAWAFARRHWRKVVPGTPFPADLHFESLASYYIDRSGGVNSS